MCLVCRAWTHARLMSLFIVLFGLADVFCSQEYFAVLGLGHTRAYRIRSAQTTEAKIIIATTFPSCIPFTRANHSLFWLATLCKERQESLTFFPLICAFLHHHHFLFVYDSKALVGEATLLVFRLKEKAVWATYCVERITTTSPVFVGVVCV